MSNEACSCPCCREGIEAPHEYHLERRSMPIIRDFLGRPAPAALQEFLRALDNKADAPSGVIVPVHKPEE